jgi:LemA protein
MIIMSSGWIMVAVLAVLVGYLVFSYNGMVAMRRRADQAFADIDVQLKQRHDLVPNLIETVKGYASHERETFDAVIKARQGAVSAAGQPSQGQAEQALSGAVGKLLALAESYPDLKASANFQSLQLELANLEDKLSAARRFFNNSVGEYNTSIESVPAVFFARTFGFMKREFFDLGDDGRAQLGVAPTVKF